PVAPQVGRRAPDGLPPMVAVRLLVRLPQQALHLMGIQAVQSPPHRLPTLRVPSQRLAQLLVHVVAVQHEYALAHVLTALPDPPRPVASPEACRQMLPVVMPVQIPPHRGSQLWGVLQPADVLRTDQLLTAIWPDPPPRMHVHQSRLPTSP